MRALIIGNSGHADTNHVRNLSKTADLVICADAGAEIADRLNLKIHWVIGDFDSISPDLLKKLEGTSQLERHPEQKDHLDLDLAYQKALDLKASTIDVVGWADERIDYTLSHLLAWRDCPADLHLWTQTTEVRLLNRWHSELQGGGPQKLSMVSLDPHLELQSQGLRWELQWRGPGPHLSQSNEARGPFWIRITSGAAYVVLER